MPQVMLSNPVMELLNETYRGKKEKKNWGGDVSLEDESYSETIMKLHNIIKKLDRDGLYIKTAKSLTVDLKKKEF
jgi:hypothetical protein